MTLAILGLGTALPETIINQDEALTIARRLIRPTGEQDTWLPGMYSGTRIRTRHLALAPQVARDVLDGTDHSGSPFLPKDIPGDLGPTTAERMRHYAELAPPLAIKACARALTASPVGPDAITHLVTVSCTGFVAPGLDRELVVGLGLPATVERTHVGFMGCHGALNGLRVARAFASSPEARVLLCATELCSLHYHYAWNPQKVIANALFADGSAAVVAAAEGPPDAWRALANGSCLVPNSADAMTWTIGEYGYEMTLARNVPALIGKHLRPFLEAWLGKQGLSMEAVRSWAVHPGGPRILTAVEEALGLRPEALAASYAVLGRCGNMSSPTLLFILDEMMRGRAERPCVALGFGPGLTVEAALWG
jgi:prepilin-type processing-associated H-X9-DG protein